MAHEANFLSAIPENTPKVGHRTPTNSDAMYILGLATPERETNLQGDDIEASLALIAAKRKRTTINSDIERFNISTTIANSGVHLGQEASVHNSNNYINVKGCDVS